MKLRNRGSRNALLICLVLLAFMSQGHRAATPGLPFTEDFSDTLLKYDYQSTANWSIDEQALLLAWRQRQYGAFGSGTVGSNLTSDSHPTDTMALGDVDGDGDLDLVAGNYGQVNRLYLNNGSPNPWNGVTGSDITSDVQSTYSVALGDVDGDGDLDFVAGNYGEVNRLYLNNGTSDPWNGVTGIDITADVHNTYQVKLADVDSDGDLDLVTGNWSETNRLYLNNGTANPWNGVIGSDITADAHGTAALALGDVDNDGDLDLVAVNLSQPNRLYLNNGSANPWNGVTGSDITSDAYNARSAALGDVDGDGDLDLVTGNWSAANRLYLNNGTADPWNGVSGSDITTDAHNTAQVQLGDVDGDGDLDFVAGNYYYYNLLYLNNGSPDPWNGVTGTNITNDWYYTRAVALGDVDGDGLLDLVSGNASGSSGQVNRLYINTGSANPWSGISGSNITSDFRATYPVALGDVDGDGDLDLVAGNYNQTNRLYLNNGTSDPWNGVAGSDITADVHPTYALALGDVDADGDLDLVATNVGQANRLYLNNGTSDPWNGVSGSDITLDAHSTYAVALGDVDGDGDLDLVAGNYNQTNRLYLNNGTSDPWNGVAGSDITADVHYTISLALADVDGDGDIDLVAGDNYYQPNRLYLNNGTPDPWNGVAGSDITSDSHDTYSLALGDVDSDGDLDLVVGNYNQTNRLYLNNGSADPWNGVTGSDITSNALATRTVKLADVNADGHLDLVTVNGTGYNYLYLNNGSSDPFDVGIAHLITPDTNNSRSGDVGDVDGDGDLDLVIGNYNQTHRLYLSNAGAMGWSGIVGSDITADADVTESVALGDVDGDGDIDLVAGNYGQANRLYLNNGTSDPWNGVAGSDITADAHSTYSLALGDVDGDGDLDLVVGNYSSTNRLYLNNGTSDPWNGVTGSDITSDADSTRLLVLADVDGDGDLDLVAANDGQPNRLYLSNGTSDPWNGVSGSDITTDAHYTYAVALGDVDNDGDLDLVAGNDTQANRLYLNNGTSDPWNGVSGSDITADTGSTDTVALGDVDGDGDLDLVSGNDAQTNRLYLNNGTSDPWNGVIGSDITTDAHHSRSMIFWDLDADGDLDLVVGNDTAQTNRLYLNNGTTDPWGGVTGVDLVVDTNDTRSVALGDVDGDGGIDIVAGNSAETNRLHNRIPLFDTSRGRASSLKVDTETSCITNATLAVAGTLPVNTHVDFWLTNNGGVNWFKVQPGLFIFPTCGTYLRWRADLHSLSPAYSPRIDQIDLSTQHTVPDIGNRVWEDFDGDGIQDAGEPGIVSALVYLYDGTGSLLDFTFTDSAGNYVFPRSWASGAYYVRFIPPPGYVISPSDQGGDDGLDSDADPSTGYTPSFTLTPLQNDDTRWDAGMTPATACYPPDEPIYLYDVTLSTDGNNYPILHFQDFNQLDQVTGYNVYRSSDPGTPEASWPLAATDIIDGDQATPNKQWVDISGDVSPTGAWYYSLTAYNHHCPLLTAEGPH